MHPKNYVEQLNFFFAANDITNNKKRAVLLGSCELATNKMFRSSSQPCTPGEKSYTELVQLIKTYQNPKPNKFNSRNRLPDETISTYIAELRQLTGHCAIGTILQEMLRDRLVCGIRRDCI